MIIEDLNVAYKANRYGNVKTYLNEQCERILSNRRSDALLFGFTADSSNLICSQYIAKRIKKELQHSLIVFGGAMASLLGDRLLQSSKWIDFVIRGRGEKPLYELYRHIGNGRKMDIHRVSSLIFRCDNKIVVNPVKDSSKSFINYSAHQLYDNCDLSQYEQQPDTRGYAYIESGRGCMGKCAYCTSSRINNGDVVYRSPSRILDEMYYINEKTGLSKFWFTMDDFSASRREFIKSIKFMADKMNPFMWKCYCRINNLDETTVRLMKLANCSEIFLGIESVNQKQRCAFNKSISDDKAKHIIKCCNENEIKTELSFIIIPHNENVMLDFYETLDFCLYYYFKKNTFHISILDCFYNTPLFQEHYGYIRRSKFKETTNEYRNLYADKGLVPDYLLYPDTYTTVDDSVFITLQNSIYAIQLLLRHYKETLFYIYKKNGISGVEDFLNENQAEFDELLNPKWNCKNSAILMKLKKIFKGYFQLSKHAALIKVWNREHAALVRTVS